MLGKPAKQLTRLEVEHSTLTYVVTAVLITVLGAGIVWFAHVLPSLR